MKKLQTMKALLVVALLGVGTSAWGQGVWDFTDTSKWSDSKFSSEATYGPDGTTATLGGSGITFNLSGKVIISQDAGMNFKSDASATLDGDIPTNNYIKVSVPAGYKAAVEYYGYNTSRYLGFTFNNVRTTGPAVVYTKREFDNSEGADAVDLYIYAVGVNRDGHARLLSINLVDMASSTHSWTVTAKANISGVQTTIDTYSSTSGNYTTTIHEGENYYVPAKRVITYGGKKYELNDANYTGKYMYKRYNMGTSNANYDITYIEAPEIVYYSEIEDAASKQHTTSNKASGGKYVNYMTTKTISDAFPAGKYIVEANMFCRKLDGETHFYLYASDDESTKFADFTAQHDEGIKTAEFVLASPKTLVYGNSSNSAACDYILIRTAPVSYTVEYKCGATVLKTADATRTAPWGTTVAITNADKENIFYSEGHATYQYASDNASSTTIASDGSSVITVEFTQVPLYTQTNVTDAETWDWSVITSATSQLTDATTPKKNEYFILKNLELLEGYSIPAGFGDAQKLNVRGEYGFRIVSDTKFFQGANIKFTTEVPGTIEVQFSNTGSNGERHLTVNGVEKGDGTSSTDKVTASGIPVAAGDVVLGASTNYLRFYKIIFTPVTSVSATITSGGSGWATLYTPYALNFSGTGLTAYIATCTSSTVTLTPVDNVPANTGVVLKGATGNYDIPVIASSDTDKGHLTGSATVPTAYNAYTGYDLYMLALNGNNEAQFTLVNAGSIAAGKAFLKISSGASSLARTLKVVIADEATGIVNAMLNNKEEIIKDNMFFNLQGQRVDQPSKGLYIVNGRKVLVK